MADSFDSARQFHSYCQSLCYKKCNLIYHDISLNYLHSFNLTKLNLIPISSTHLRFTETFKIDINGLIYNLGGILGLWFGMSPLSIVYLISLFTKIFRKTKQITSSITRFKLLP